jgi:uncharacterized protein
MNTASLFSLTGSLGLLLGIGAALGLLDRRNFNWRWLLVAAGLAVINDAMLTRLFGLIPDPFTTSDWNWLGKFMALGMTLVIAAHPSFGWVRSGITLRQNSEGRPLTYAVIAVLILLFAMPGLTSPNEPVSWDHLGFQLTMPGLEEEPFYRGILLLALNEAFRGRRQILGISIGWGALVSCVYFGICHALSFENGAFGFDAVSMLLTGVPAILLIWVRERTGSLLWPVLLHNFANSASLLF